MAPAMKLQRGDAVPHVQVRTVSGEVFSYATIWQRRNLVLAVVGVSPADDAFATALNSRVHEFRDLETECVITHDEVPGVAVPGLIVADKWGEVVHMVEASDSGGLPSPGELLEWVEYVRHRCPECEGEAR